MPTITITDLNNAQLDVNTIAGVATSTAATVTDRLGNTKNTLAGMNAAVLASAAAVQGSIGYLPPVAYAAGVSLTLAAQTVSYSGQVYAPILSALPFVASGTFETAKFRLVQGVTLDYLNSTVAPINSSIGLLNSNITQSPKLCIFGDSISRYNNVYGSDQTSYNTSYGYWTWANILTNNRMRYEPANNFAISGQTTVQMLARVNTVVAASPKLTIFLGGINDILGNLSAASIIANITAIITALTAGGSRVIVGMIWPSNNFASATQRQVWLAVNTWLRMNVPTIPGCFLWDTFSALNDPSSSLFGIVAAPPASSMTADGLHPTKVGAYWVGRALADLIEKVVPAASLPSRSMFGAGDVFDAVNNPTGNYLGSGGAFFGVGGTKGAGMTGDVADGWDLFANSGTNVSCVASIELTPMSNGQVYRQQVLTLTSTGVGGGSEIYLGRLTNNYVSGDVVRFGFDVSVSSPNRVQQVAARIQRQYGDYGATVDNFDPNGLLIPAPFTGHMLTPPLTLTGTGTQCYALLSIILDTSAAASVVVKIGRAYVRR